MEDQGVLSSLVVSYLKKEIGGYLENLIEAEGKKTWFYLSKNCTRRDCKDAVMCSIPAHAKMIRAGGKQVIMAYPTILYIEDNFDNRLLVRRVLVAEGYEVIDAANAEKALEWLSSGRPDLILMDINMPDIDGYTLTARIRSMPGFDLVPIIALTANVMRGDREKSLEAGCDGYIQKPVDIDLLPAQVLRYLRKK